MYECRLEEDNEIPTALTCMSVVRRGQGVSYGANLYECWLTLRKRMSVVRRGQEVSYGANLYECG